MRLAQMLKLYATAIDGMSLARIAEETYVPLPQLQAWINGNDAALNTRQFARLQCWTFSRAPVREVAREAVLVDSDGGHCD
jgi:hypothetical protein